MTGHTMQKLTIGLGVIHAEAGEMRAFLPDFVSKISRFFSKVILEFDYGKKMGYISQDYTKLPNIFFRSAEEVYAQDFVLVLRFPPQEYLELIPPGHCLISMCHLPTRPSRRTFLHDHGIEAVSLDSIIDDNGQRLVENLRSVAWNGCEVAFQVLNENLPPPGLNTSQRKPLNITILGSGGVGTQAVQAAIRYGNPERWQTFAQLNIPGNIVRVIDYDFTIHTEQVKRLLSTTDLLIDATLRKNPSEIIIQNKYLGLLPNHAVILDLSVDPYDFRNQPYEVKGIEGIPQGNLDQYIFSPQDPAWETLPKIITTRNRRWVVSCYSWPGLHPRACMLRYGNQISPLLRRLVNTGGVRGINPRGQYHDRAIAKGILSNWMDE